MKYVTLRTANMGSCWCGDCFCRVYEDGTVEYEGQEEWQNSERGKPRFDKKVIRTKMTKPGVFEKYEDLEDVAFGNRAYSSGINSTDYHEALTKLGEMV